MKFIMYLSIIVFVLYSCNEDKNSLVKEKSNSLDSIWLQFSNAMDNNDINFLLKNSIDTITCYDCNITENNDKIYFDAKFIFENHIDKVMHIKNLSKPKYSIAKIGNNLIKIVYSIHAVKAPEGGYSLIFTLIKKNKKYYFQGMMVQ